MSAPDRDAVERRDLRTLLDRTTGRTLDERVDAILAAGWSRSSRPAAVTEEAVEAAARALYASRSHSDDETWEEVHANVCSGARADVRVALTAALPLLAPGQSEAEVRADERARIVAWLEKHMFADGVMPAFNRGIEYATALARTAPAEDGAE